MKKILIIILSILAIPVYSQKVRFEYHSGWGIYSLSKLKELQTTFSQQVKDLPVKIITQFPDYINHNASIDFYLDKNILFGFNSTYLTTGGRNHIRDYSGEYKLDMILNGLQLGIESERIYPLKNNFNLNANFKLGATISDLNISETLNIYGMDELMNKQKYVEICYFLEPDLNLSYNINKQIVLLTGIGYNFNTSTFYGGLIDWGGFRFRLGLSYSI